MKNDDREERRYSRGKAKILPNYSCFKLKLEDITIEEK